MLSFEVNDFVLEVTIACIQIIKAIDLSATATMLTFMRPFTLAAFRGNFMKHRLSECKRLLLKLLLLLIQ